MMRSIVALVVMLATLALTAPAMAQARDGQAAGGQRGGVTGMRADVSCHSPCDDPFQVKAWVRGSNVGGLVVRFEVKGKVYSAQTTSGGFAHCHLKMRPSAYPQGVVVKVKASVTHAGATKSASTWFKPNYN